jgi:hypothetical protein
MEQCVRRSNRLSLVLTTTARLDDDCLGVRFSRSVLSDPIHLLEVIRGPSVGEVPVLMLYCDTVVLRDFLYGSPCTAATMATLLAGILSSVESLCLLLP